MSDSSVIVGEHEILELLTALVDKSLVVFDEATGRYRLLETVRQYGRDRLVESGDGETWRGRHLGHFLALGEKAEPHLSGPEQPAWLDLLECELDNMRAALEWSEGEVALRLAASLWPFWDVRGYFSEGQELLSGALAQVDANTCPATRAAVLMGAGVLARSQGKYAAAQVHLEGGLSIYQRLGDKRGTAHTLNYLGMAAFGLGDYAAAKMYHEESLALHRELGNKDGAAYSLYGLGCVAENEGNLGVAWKLYDESLALQRELGNKRGIAWSLSGLWAIAFSRCEFEAARALGEERLSIERDLGNTQGIAYSNNSLGYIDHIQADYATARRRYEESLAWVREAGDRIGIIWSLENLAAVLSAEGDNVASRALYEQSLALLREYPDGRDLASSGSTCGDFADSQGEYRAARMHYEESLRRNRLLHNNHQIAGLIGQFGRLAARCGQVDRAARLWGAEDALRLTIGCGPAVDEQTTHDADWSDARRQLGDAGFRALFDEGRAMTMEQAIEYALRDTDE